MYSAMLVCKSLPNFYACAESRFLCLMHLFQFMPNLFATYSHSQLQLFSSALLVWKSLPNFYPCAVSRFLCLLPFFQFMPNLFAAYSFLQVLRFAMLLW